MIKTKIDIISGFLGAGKTTFIKKLVQDLYPLDKVVILENEFGRINIDEETLGREGLAVKPIQAGCICCSSSMDLSKGINEIMEEYAPERIIVEPTGIAKLSEIKKILFSEEINDMCEIGHIITIVDAKNYYLRTMISKVFFEDQIKASRVIFLSKTNEMKDSKISEVKEEINRIQPGCLVIHEQWNKILPGLLAEYINYAGHYTDIRQRIRIRPKYQNDFDRYEIIKEEPFDIEVMEGFIQDVILGSYGELHRIKGICYDSKRGPYSIDYLPGETIIKPIKGDFTGDGQSKVCLIGRNLNKEKLDTI